MPFYENAMLTAREAGSEKVRLVVDRLWCVSDAAADGYETLLPSGRVQIIFSLSGLRLCEHGPDGPHQGPGALHVFQGPSTTPRRVWRKPQIALCGVSFQPGGAGAVFGAVDDTTDRVIDLARFWGGDAARLRDRLRALETHEARLDLLEGEIERRIGDISAAAVLNGAIARLRKGVAVRDVCEELGLSPYLFRRLFLRNAGLTPKHYLRIERFRAAVDRLTAAGSLSDLAFEVRYSDQSHMTREVERFASTTPARLRARIRPYAGHVLDPAP